MDSAAPHAWLLDLDGVLTPTAELHRLAWARLFEGYGYSEDDYFAHIDGKPRFDGVRDFLASRGVAAGEAEVQALGNAKNAVFADLLATRGIAPYPGTIEVLDAWSAAGAGLAVVSSSRNARDVLAAAGLSDRFTLVVDGTVAAAAALAGKPDPATFLYAARQLGVAPEQAAVVEDALSGVAAGRAGGFGLVVGVDRGAGAAALLAAGAHRVVADLRELVAGSAESGRAGEVAA